MMRQGGKEGQNERRRRRDSDKAENYSVVVAVGSIRQFESESEGAKEVRKDRRNSTKRRGRRSRRPRPPLNRCRNDSSNSAPFVE